MAVLIKIYDFQSDYITPNFPASEIYNASHPNLGENFVTIDKRAVEIAQYIREQLDRSILINSAFRNLIYNRSIGSNDSSQHPKGTALDLHGAGIVEFMETARREQNHHWHTMKLLGLGGLGLYDWGVHIDTREHFDVAFWDYRKKKVET